MGYIAAYDGVKFPATQAASSDANTLDDYDEYSPSNAACTGAITTSTTYKVTKVGRLVTLHLPAAQGTASAVTSFTFGTTLPAKYRPAANAGFAVVGYDNGANLAAPSLLLVTSAGAVTVFRELTATTSYTAAAVAGLAYETAVCWNV